MLHANITRQICALFCRLIRLFSKIPVINDDLPLKILSGSVIIKPNVKEINGSTVVFTDGTIVEKVGGIAFLKYLSFEASFRIIPHLLFAGGHNCVCHRLQLRFSLPAKQHHVQVRPPSGSVQACFPSKSGAPNFGYCGLHPCPRSHHAPS